MNGLTRHDKGWAELNNQRGPRMIVISPKPIGYINKQNRIVRFAKAVALCATTNYSWSVSWHQAAK